MNSSTLKLLLFAFASILQFSCESTTSPNFCPNFNCTESTSSFSVLFSDNFNRTDGDLASSNWTLVNSGGSSIGTNSNEVLPLSNQFFAPIAYYDQNLSSTAYRASVEANITGSNWGSNVSTGDMGIFALSQSSTDFSSSYFCGMLGAVNSGKLIIFVVSNGNSVNSAASIQDIPFDNGDSYNIVFTIQDGTLTCSVSGSFESTITLTDTSYSSGYIGFGGGNLAATAETELTYDNFQLETID